MRVRVWLLVSAVLLCTFAWANAVRAAGEVVVTASPPQVRLGQSVEVMVRTFVPFKASEFQLPKPRAPYPVPTGLWNVLYPWDDYPFDIEARSDDGASIRIVVARDAHDATLWRGTFIPTASGSWSVYVRNFTSDTPGASTVVRVTAGLLPDDSSVPVITVILALGLGAIVGALVATFVYRGTRRGPRAPAA